MHFFALIFSLLLAGCDLWVPSSFPIPVYIRSNVTHEERLALLDALTEWSEALGEERLSQVFDVKHNYDRLITRNGISVEAGRTKGKDVFGTSDINAFTCQITFSRAKIKKKMKDGAPFQYREAVSYTLLHELGHCLGYHNHDTDPNSVMNTETELDGKITDHVIETVLDAMSN